MRRPLSNIISRSCGAAILLLVFVAGSALSQGFGGPREPPASAREAAANHFDLTGYWVPVITEDWLARMVVPPPGYNRDVLRMPVNEEGIRIAAMWDPAKDEQAGLACKSFGAANIMRMPTRLHITWEDDDVLRIDTDYGQQSRFLRFAAVAAGPDAGNPSRQGASRAEWKKQRQGRGFGPGPNNGPGTLKVVTTAVLPGYLSRNGIPHSGDVRITEYFARHDDFGDEWFTVTTVVEDPTYLSRPYVTSTHFRREADDRQWRPRPCEIVRPIDTPEGYYEETPRL